MSPVTILVSVLAVAATAGGLAYGANPSWPLQKDMTTAEGEKRTGFVELDLLAIPIIRNAAIESYLIGRFALEVDAEKAIAASPEFKLRSTDALIGSLYAQISRAQAQDDNSYALATEIRETMAQRMNRRLGKGTIKAVEVIQLDIFSKDVVRKPRLKSLQ